MKRLTFLLIVSLSFAAIEFSGDARYRPRYDVKKYDSSGVADVSDFYYLYRARINMKADIGEGWFFKTQLGTNDVAGMTKMSPGDVWEGPGNPNSSRPNVSFLELYYGYAQENKGLWVGAFPLKYTPAYDLHFYSEKLVDIPWILNNNSSVTGISGYKIYNNKKFNWFLSIDENNINSSTNDNGIKTEQKDKYTFGLNSTTEIFQLSITNNLLFSFGDGDLPTTYGIDIGLPKFSKISSNILYHISSNDIYNADHFRFLLTRKINNGSMKFFYDVANNEDNSMSYVWLSYTHLCYKGDLGSVTITPTYRYQNGGTVEIPHSSGMQVFDKNYTRSKFEITTEIKFK